MIKLKISGEMVTDLLTPNISGANKLIEGLPEYAVLVGVTFTDGMVEYIFNDGKKEESICKVQYIKPL